jgi:uncharacterized protein YciI
MAAAGQMLLGGAILDEAGEMIGSMTVVDLASRAEVDRWLATDPYVAGKVWERIEVHPMRVTVRAATA